MSILIKIFGSRANVYLAFIVLVAAILFCAYVNLAPGAIAELRHMYCTANEAQAIECTQKGWW